MVKRRKVMEEMCSQNIGVSEKKIPRKALHAEKYDFYICLVAKVASTFWSRVLYQLHNTYPVESPFNIGIYKAYGGLEPMNANKYLHSALKNITTKAVFVREPYGRLFSAYIDKLLSPNPVFWKAWGQRAILKFRPDAPKKKFIFGNDTTFSEFISFTTDVGYTYDPHLLPVYKNCVPCKVNFTAVGKMETFERDAKYVMSRLGIPEKQIGFDRMKADQEQDALYDSTGGTFSAEWLRSTLRCISLEAVAQRVWRKLQIRGFISWRQPLRLNPYQREHLDMAEMVHMLKRAKEASTNSTELKIQKKQAFLEAFRTLKPYQIQDIIQVYGPDFKLFGYDAEMVETMLEDHADLKNTDSLDWSKDWDLTPVLGS